MDFKPNIMVCFRRLEICDWDIYQKEKSWEIYTIIVVHAVNQWRKTVLSMMLFKDGGEHVPDSDSDTAEKT